MVLRLGASFPPPAGSQHASRELRDSHRSLVEVGPHFKCVFYFQKTRSAKIAKQAWSPYKTRF